MTVKRKVWDPYHKKLSGGVCPSNVCSRARAFVLRQDILDAWMWACEEKDEQGEEHPGILESLCWIEGYECIAERATDRLNR